MIAISKKAFKLPRVEKDTFILLLRLGLEYNRETGTYKIANFNNINRLVGEISRILNSEISFMQSCSICGKDITCVECKYYAQCTTRNLPLHCICQQCLREK